MALTMFDSVTAGNIPANAAAVGGYINGRYKWSMADWQRFHGFWVPIWVYIPGATTNGYGDGQAAAVLAHDWLNLKAGSTVVLDVEAGDMNSVGETYADGWGDGVRSLNY